MFSPTSSFPWFLSIPSCGIMINESKVILLGLVAVVLCGTASAVQPGCRTRFELRMKWTFQGDSSTYWECSSWGNAIRRACPVGTLFSSPFQTCIPSRLWEEFPFYAPPTTVNDYADECTEYAGTCDNPCQSACNGGEWVNGQCVCPPNHTLQNGTCVYYPSDDSCGEHGFWSPWENRCECDAGYYLRDGRCVSFDTSGRCEGASDEAHLVPGTMDCLPVDCSDNQYWPNTLFPTRNPGTFFQCANQLNVVERPCAPGTCFDYSEQVCVHARKWVNQCN